MDLVTLAMAKKYANDLFVEGSGSIDVFGVWDENQYYPKNSMVTNGSIVYISIKDVAVGTPITDTNSWQVFMENAVDRNYVHTQAGASAEWIVAHNLGKFPSVTVIDSAGSQVIGDVTYTDINNLTIKFLGAFSGKAYLN